MLTPHTSINRLDAAGRNLHSRATVRRWVFRLAPLILILSIVGCAGDRAAAEETVDGFLRSISSGNRETLTAYFPAFAALDPAEQDAYLLVFSKVSGWNVEKITIDGTNAVAVVKAATATGELPLYLPLVHIGKRWVVAEKTSMRSDLGTVEAE